MTSQDDSTITRRTALIRGGTLVGLILGGTAAVGSASAQGPPDDFPGSETGEENSEDGRENAACRGKGKGSPPGTDDDNGGPGTPGASSVEQNEGHGCDDGNGDGGGGPGTNPNQ